MEMKIKLSSYDIPTNTASLDLSIHEGDVSLSMVLILNEHQYKKIRNAQRLVRKVVSERPLIGIQELGVISYPVSYDDIPPIESCIETHYE